MSYKEKQTYLSIFSAVVLSIIYSLNILSQYSEANSSDLRFWAISMLTFIGISVVIMIILHIIFHILLAVSIAIVQREDKNIEKEMKNEMLEDERDSIIELKAMKAGYIFSSTGFILAIISLALNYPPAIMLNILFFSYMFGSMIEGIFQLYYYRKN